MNSYDLAVIGGGASGLMAAVTAAEECAKNRISAKIAVLEANPRVGKKLLATGNGRCNLTNRYADVTRFHGDAGLAAPMIENHTPQKLIERFLSFGLLCKELDEGRVYPNSLQASAVLDALRLQMERLKVETICDFPVTAVKKSGSGFDISSSSGQIRAKRVILACGGKAYPQLGSDGSGYQLASSLGHSVTELFPALVQVKTDPRRAKPLKGARSAASATLFLKGKPVKTVSGEVQFTENGLSGICIFELSRQIGQAGAAGRPEISLDLLAEYSVEQIVPMLTTRKEALGDLPAADLLNGCVNKLVGREVVRAALFRVPEHAAYLKREELSAVAERVKDFRFDVLGTLSWKDAQITAGGIPLRETDENLQSILCSGLYFAGELLNIDGDCGGFNLHWAWSSGITAGSAAALSLRKK
ncbi:BaiN/RdsA family NAD(P)/FAD-dependent oxidoreductase [Caproiciproducens faecalis]|uniref:Aminoacetone oxidase family FAD-binding enzyme n=1 Tax=Caproiciproducens faecalis TaxID=2820301 RepID=A0ABS7DKH6_9FIRM|nr:aminoacetone oxidase family FAD-binding enzyme [Caproiciproducens faecalis]MBW7571796.1 aminoacetone oxidase family FAD-binding enzyme [Caproiciproducens faecalis]